jgi:hypothetical protein
MSADSAATPPAVDYYVEAILLALDVPEGRVTDNGRDRITDGHPATRPFLRLGPSPETDLMGAMRIGLDEKTASTLEFGRAQFLKSEHIHRPSALTGAPSRSNAAIERRAAAT